ncbi:MAG TPA: TlpA disulfide reductase family protein [Acidimicrobiales bacterium]|nr:TlpA disulfide reductase family protein [Acidimicrobiales bacterium]
MTPPTDRRPQATRAKGRGSRADRSRGGRPQQSRSGGGRSRSSIVVAAVVGAVVVVALIVAVVAGGGGDDDTATDGTATDGGATGQDAGDAAGSDAATTGTVEVSGTPLPALPDSGDDPAVGQAFPTLTGVDQSGAPMTITADGRPKMIVFVAHWCPHCQREVPVVQDWVDEGNLPDWVDLVSVSTAIDPTRPNFPPDAWLADEGWTAPVLVDADNAAAEAAGLPAYPYFVAIDPEGKVVTRASGELSTEALDAIVADLTATAAG